MAKLGVIAILIVLAATSCNKEQYWYGRKITFVAKSKGYMTKSQATKTAYAGEDETVDTKLRERIDWNKNDRIYVYCGSAINDGDDSHYAEYGVEDFSAESDAVSKASIQPTDYANSMEWGNGTHDFYAMYPSPKGHATNSFTAGTMVFNMPAAYPVAPKTAQVTKDAINGIINFKPDMDYAPMLAAQTGVSAGAGSVTLPFTPQFDAFEITIGKATYSTINLSQFRIYGAEGDKLSGTFTVTPANYAAVATITDATNAVTLDLDGKDGDTSDDIILDADYPTLKLTVLTLPGTFTNGITIEFTGEFDGAEQTRKLTLKTNTGDFVEFAPYKKYRIYGLTFPVLVGATIEDGISWDFGLEIMDGVIWWIGSAMVNHITWTDDIDINAYTVLPDDVKWFEGSYIVNDFRWEELDHIALDDDSDAYLWRNQSLTRTVQAYNREGSAFSDVKASWSATQEGRVIHLNQTTGEVTALGPGEATVTAKVTPNDGSDPWTVSYKVYVNAPTGITLTAAKNFVKPSGTVGLTATVTSTSNGTISSYPADLLEWSSANTTYITLSDEESQPAAATGLATAIASGLAEGSSTITVSVAAKYADGISDSLTDFPCRIDGTIGGIYISRGFLVKPKGETALTLSDGSDPFEMLNYYQNNGDVDELIPPSQGYINTDYQRHYFNFKELCNYFGGYGLNGNTLTGNSDIPTTNCVSYDGHYWRMPTLAEVKKFTSSYYRTGATVSNGSSSESGKLFCKVIVDLTGTSYASMGLTQDTWVQETNTHYIAGLILFPDGASITCPGLNPAKCNKNNDYASISASDLISICSGSFGCVFLPAAGRDANAWGGSFGYYMTGSNYNNMETWFSYFGFNSTDVDTSMDAGPYLAAFLVRVDD